jgi:hypothetical protein
MRFFCIFSDVFTRGRYSDRKPRRSTSHPLAHAEAHDCGETDGADATPDSLRCMRVRH